MAQNKNASYDTFRKQLKAGQIAPLYVFFGEERYLLEHSLASLRELLLSGGFADFNHRRLNGENFSIDALTDAVNTLPAFAERTLVEVHDVDIFKLPEEPRNRLAALLTELPEHVCLVFVFDTVPYSPDGRTKLAALIKSKAQVVEFPIQDPARLVQWIQAHAARAGKVISKADGEYLAFLTGNSMTALKAELDKLCQYAEGDTVTRAHIDALVSPTPDAAAYELTDRIVSGRFDEAAKILTDLFAQQEPAQKLIYSVTLALRRLHLARLYLDAGKSQETFMQVSGLRFPFQAKALFAGARKLTAESCRRAVLASAQAAADLNSGSDGQARLSELLAQLLIIFRGAR